jgi:hypothetical protein
MATIISSQGASRPAPRWWRSLERGLLLVLIPASTAIIQGVTHSSTMALQLNLYINTGLVAIIKFIGMMLVDTEDNYVSNLTAADQNKVDVNNPPVDPKV